MKISNKNLYIVLAAASAALLLNLFAAVPIYQAVSSDVLYIHTFLPDVLELLANLLEMSFIAVFHAALIYVLLVRRGKRGRGALYCFGAVLAAGYILRIGMTLFDQKAIEIIDLVSSGIYFSIDALLALAVLVCALINKRKTEKKLPPLADGHFFTPKNPLKLCIGFSALLLALLRVIFRAFYDFAYGAPSSFAEVLLMVCFYTSDILLGAAAYVIEYFVLSLLLRSDEKRKEKIDGSFRHIES